MGDYSTDVDSNEFTAEMGTIKLMVASMLGVPLPSPHGKSQTRQANIPKRISHPAHFKQGKSFAQASKQGITYELPSSFLTGSMSDVLVPPPSKYITEASVVMLDRLYPNNIVQHTPPLRVLDHHGSSVHESHRQWWPSVQSFIFSHAGNNFQMLLQQAKHRSSIDLI
jgi:hypothetical protein